MKSELLAKKAKRPSYVAAIVVGAALSTLGAASAEAAVTNVSRYCTTCWRNAHIQPDSWSDCTQEVLIRLIERVRPEAWQKLLTRESEEHRELLRAIDAVKKRTQRAHRPAMLADDVADNTIDRDARRTELRKEITELSQELLSQRQAEIISMSLDGWSIHEIADHLGVSPMRVSDEKYKAIQKLRAAVS